MSHKETIEALKSFDYSQYKDISSYEKLMAFAAYKLVEAGVPLTFNYICIASFKLFPEKFCCDEEFREFPSVDRLNRTAMHLKYTKRPSLVGDIRTGYTLTKIGEASAIEVESIINNTPIDSSIKAPVVDEHKKGIAGDYYRVIESDDFKKFLKIGKVDQMFIWKFFEVIPFTQVSKIKKSLSETKKYAKELRDKKCLDFVKAIEETMPKGGI